MSKFTRWYWFKQTIRQMLFNFRCDEKSFRQWMVNEERLEQLQQMENDYKLVKAEADLYRVMYQTQRQKNEEIVQWIREQWGIKYEK